MTRTLLLGLTAALVATCAAATGPVSAARRGFVAADVARRAPAAAAPVATVVDGLTAFGYEVSRRTARPDRNWVMSPLSVAYAFGMARAGADGQTAAQLDRVFGFPAGGPHEALNALDARLATDRGPLRVANSLWVRPGLPLGEKFLGTLAADYGTGVRTVDFGSPGAVEAINGWVREHTEGRIPRLLDRLSPAAGVVLANAIHFEAKWRTPFRHTDPGGVFTRADGSTVRTPLMHDVLPLRYAEGVGWRAVELPYTGSGYAMWVLLPEPSGAAPVELLAPGVLAAVGAALSPVNVDMTLPTWDFGSRLDLLEVMRALGFTDLGGFPGINPTLTLGEAVHRADITVDEEGTEASAATALVFPVSAGPAAQVAFRADRPFAYAVVHTATGTPAFVGTVADPAA